MKVKALDDSHLLVILTAQEAGSLGLGAKVLREGADGCRAVMERLLAAACRQTGFSCERRRGKVGIHAMPTVEGEWVLVFSDLVMQKPPAACGEQLPKRRTYRIKECAGPYGYRFPSCEDALRVLERLFYENMLCPCQFIRLGEGYYLVAHPKRRGICCPALPDAGIWDGLGTGGKRRRRSFWSMGICFRPTRCAGSSLSGGPDAAGIISAGRFVGFCHAEFTRCRFYKKIAYSFHSGR